MFQRALDLGARVTIALSRSRVGWAVGTAALALAKCVENMELGHNIAHGQWDWMNDPEIHSNTWEWDMVSVSSQWRYSHNYAHHVFTNVIDMDHDVGFGIMRMTRDEPWEPIHLLQPAANVLLATTFEWGIARHGLHAEQRRDEPPHYDAAQKKALRQKVARQLLKDYVAIPALSGRRWKRTLTANAAANLLRNLWAYTVIFCGHFPDGAQKFTTEAIESETRADWYLRQMLGTANFTAGKTLAFLSGNLCYQIEHHLYPDLPSNRYAEISLRVRALCDKYDLPYNTASLGRQFLLSQRTVLKLTLPDRFLTATSDDAPETSSERRFHADRNPERASGLRTALERLRQQKLRDRRAGSAA